MNDDEDFNKEKSFDKDPTGRYLKVLIGYMDSDFCRMSLLGKVRLRQCIKVMIEKKVQKLHGMK
jgi:ABC-type microcin C transport system permease subunit YejB